MGNKADFNTVLKVMFLPVGNEMMCLQGGFCWCSLTFQMLDDVGGLFVIIDCYSKDAG